jgi:superfamily II DNA or RNA helicase
VNLAVVTDVAQAIDDALNIPVHPDAIVLVRQHPDYPGYLLFDVGEDNAQEFYSTYRDWMSRYLVLNELFLLEPFCETLAADGYHVIFDPDATQILADHQRWSGPLDIEGFSFTDRRTGEPGQLFDFQRFSLNRALERTNARARDDRFFFFGWGTGAGKTLAAAAGAQELFNRHQIDVVMAFTLRRHLVNYQRFLNASTTLRTTIIDGSKDKRRSQYEQRGPGQVWVNGYAKLRFDQELMAEALASSRVLWVLDEVQELTTAGARNSWRQGLDTLVKGEDIVWPMTASAVEETPLKYRDIFELPGGDGPNPLSTAADFKHRYLRSEHRHRATTRAGGVFWITDYKWNKAKLHEVRHRVGHCTQNVRKTDPVVRENFKGLTCERLPIQMTPQHREIYEYVKALGEEAYHAGRSTIEHYNLLRYIANNAMGLHYTSEALAVDVLARFPQTHQSEFAAKLEILGDQLEAIRDAGDKAVVFTKWTNLGTNLIHIYLDRRKIHHVTHTGEMTDKAAQMAQDTFRETDVPVFLSSDAGSHGLNLPEARYVINYECPYSYDILHQRNDRVDRADSHLDGYTAYVYVTDNTLEERIWDVMEERRAVAEATTGATETLSYGHLVDDDEESDPHTRNWLLFGDAGL